MSRIEDSGKDEHLSSPSAAGPEGKGEMPHVRVNDQEEPFKSCRQQRLVGSRGPCRNDKLCASDRDSPPLEPHTPKYPRIQRKV